MNAHLGTYALILYADHRRVVQIGRLGQLAVQSGFYVYVGSAFGPGGVQARVRHHSNIAERPHWHIDYLRRAVDLKQVWYTYDLLRQEHAWANVLGNMQGASIPLPGFGASDCKCIAHLYFFPRQPRLDIFRRRIRAGLPNHSHIESRAASGMPSLVLHGRAAL